MEKSKVEMIIGITGHQNLGTPANVRWVRTQLKNAVRINSITRGITSLAVGTDQLFASLLLQLKVPYTVIVPSRDYERTFDHRTVLRYKALLNAADEIQELGYPEPSERAFLDAGKAIVDDSNLLIAVWNGLPAKGLGGTADVVNYARRRSRPVIHINPVKRSCELI